MEIAYKALTETCTLLLDVNGVCRSVLAATSSQRGGPARIPASAERCIGAQFVATLDLRDPTGLTHMPEVGAPMLFARIEIDGRITLVRSAPLISFETVTQVDSGVRDRAEYNVPAYGDDEEKTTPFEIDDDVTIPRRQSYGAHAYTSPQASYPPPEAYLPRASSPPPGASYPPPHHSMKIPITRGFELPRVTIPPPPPAMRTPQYGFPAAPSAFPAAPPIAPARRPSVARAATPMYEGVPTLPFRRVAR